jgi:ABC-type nitrate/sulfonate/bicarbonate transport system permease component
MSDASTLRAAPPAASGVKKRKSWLQHLLPFIRWIVLAVILLAWVLATEVRHADPLFLPGPTDLFERARALGPQLPSAVGYSLTIILSGFAIGCGLGVLVGLAMAYSALVREGLQGVINALRPIPIFALIPLFLLWLGIGRESQIALVAFGCFVILVVSTSEAIRNVPTIFIRASQTLGASRSQTYRTVVVPAIIPGLIGAIRVAAAASFGLDVAAEFLGAQNGLGYLMINSQLYLRTDGIVVIIVIFTILAFLLDLVLRKTTARLTRWTGRQGF